MRITFITWYPSCRRSDALAKALGGVSRLIHYMDFKHPIQAPFKYVLQTLATLRQLWRDKPEVILVASPPVFAVIPVWFYCVFTSSRFGIDAHTGVFDDPRWTWLLPLTRFLARSAATTIVTNAFLAETVQRWGAQVVVIGDVPVEFPRVQPAQLGNGSHVAVINTFSQDEPLDEVLAAAYSLPQVTFHITGNQKHARHQYKLVPPSNVRFTGWLSEEDYASLLLAADLAMCLTTHDHTMQRGAYEAMALEKPLITSDWELLRRTFCRGTIHVRNTATEIAAAVLRCVSERPLLTAGMRQLRDERLSIFATSLKALEQTFRSRP